MEKRGYSKLWSMLGSLLIVGCLIGSCSAWGSSDKVKLKDIEVLTLYNGRQTTGRRSSPVPQLKCIGGTANCGFVPQVVQCYNRGSDGYDVQWECKSDMDNAYRFGKVQVTCEGYDYPDDPYVLKGSCGLEYTIDLTKEGMANAGQYSQNHDYYGGDGKRSDYGWNPNVYKTSHKKSDWVSNLACGVVVVVIVYAIYKTCIAPGTNEARQRSNTNDDYHGRGPGSAPPPPGFRSDYYSSRSSPDSGFAGGSDSCSGNRQQGTSGTGTGTGAGGFWTGVATGGLAGYLFGNRNNTNYGGTTYRRPYTSSWGSTPGSSSSSGWSGFSSGGSSSSSSSGTRTASGFGGTSRR